MVSRQGEARLPYAAVASSLAQMGPDDVSSRASRLARAFMDQGVTFDLDGEERPFPLDVVPRIFPADEWTRVSRGVEQRVRALELFLADVYGSARIVSDGLIPHDVITSFSRLCAGGLRVRVAQRRADPRGGDRRRAGRGRRIPCARGQSPESVGGELRAGQPGCHGAGLARALLGSAHSDGQRLSRPPHQCAAPCRAGVGPGTDGRGNDARCAQLGVLRACAPGPAHGRAPGRRPRSRVPRHRRLSEDHRGGGTRPRHLPENRRRVPRSAAVPARVVGGVSRVGERGTRRSCHRRQRGRERGCRRQAGLHVRARDDPLLPRRGPNLGERRDDAPGRRRDPEGRAGVPWRPRVQAGRRIGREGAGDRADGDRDRARRAGARGRSRSPVLDRPTPRRAVHLSHLGRRCHGAPARRPPPLRGQRRGQHLGPARRAHARRAPRRRPGRELESGGWLEGHLGHRRGPLHATAPSPPDGGTTGGTATRRGPRR